MSREMYIYNGGSILLGEFYLNNIQYVKFHGDCDSSITITFSPLREGLAVKVPLKRSLQEDVSICLQNCNYFPGWREVWAFQWIVQPLGKQDSYTPEIQGSESYDSA